MKRYYLLIFCAYVVVNFCYTSYIYISSEKIDGRVIEISKEPTIEFVYEGQVLNVYRSKWGFIQSLNENENVTVLVSKKEGMINPKDIEINTFFQLWFTLYDMLLAFCICLVGTIFLGNILPDKKEKINEWK